MDYGYFYNLKIPPGWRIIEKRSDGMMWANPKRHLRVIASVAIEQDKKCWLHLSMAHARRMPTYDELVYLKRHWAGDDRKCIMVLPERSKHVNFHPYCLHLFHCFDDDGLPDFTWGAGLI